jgi:hypothetical protein
MKKLCIDAPGFGRGALIIDNTPVSCGKVVAGIGVRFETDSAGFALSWEDFEAAYLAIKAERETERFAKAAAHHRKEFEDYEATPAAGAGESK